VVSDAALWFAVIVTRAPVAVSAFEDPSTFDPAVEVIDIWDGAACVGTVEINPSPNEATAISAMRLYVDFEDIIFLSIVVIKTLLMAALRWVARADTSLFSGELKFP